MRKKSRSDFVANLPKKHVGAASELLVAAALLEQGYEVFRNVSPVGPADLIAWNPGSGELMKLDVTTGTYMFPRRSGECVLSFNRYNGNKGQYAKDYGIVHAVVGPDGRVFIKPKLWMRPDAPPEE